MENTIAVLVDYFKKELPLLEKNYNWKIPNIEGFNRSGQTGYVANVELKYFLNKSWNQTKNEQEKNILAEIVVAKWGGVKNNKPETLSSYVRELKKQKPNMPLKGIASYSKIFSITNFEKYAIYDARVAVSLNAIQINNKLTNGYAFNYVPGRNNVTGNVEKKIGFSQQEQFKVKSLVKSGWFKIKRDDTYEVYLKTLKQCLEQFPTYRLYDLEMILFANAEKEANSCLG